MLVLDLIVDMVKLEVLIDKLAKYLFLEKVKFERDINFIHQNFILNSFFDLLILDIVFLQFKNIIDIFYLSLHYFYFHNLRLNIDHFYIFHLLFYLSKIVHNFFLALNIFILQIYQYFNNFIVENF